MKKSTLKLWMAVVIICVLFSTIALTACTPKETKLNNYDVGANPSVVVTDGNGSINLVVGDDGEIAVSSVLSNPDLVTYTITKNGDTITIDAETPAGSGANITITLPANTQYNLYTGNGNINVSSVHASGHVGIGNGSAKLEGVIGDIDGNIGNGNFTMLNAEGSLDMHVGNGNVSFKGELTADGTNRVSIGNGSATVELTGTPSVALDLETDGGRVSCTHQVTATKQSTHELIGTIGGGAATLTVDTGSGNITIK